MDPIAEDSPAKQARLAGMVQAEANGQLPESYAGQARWIGAVKPTDPKDC